jgi:hypothetical protein
LVLVALLLVGFEVTRRRLGAILERKSFLCQVHRSFRALRTGGGAQDESLYVELTERVVRMQREIGGHGVMALFRPPFANYAYRDYPLLVNMLPDYRRSANDWALHRHASECVSTIRDALVRYSGSLSELEEDARRSFRNPMVWFKEGVRFVVSSPFRLLRSLGILSAGVESNIVGSTLVRVASGIVALVTLVAGLVQIVTGWDASIALLHRMFGK